MACGAGALIGADAMARPWLSDGLEPWPSRFSVDESGQVACWLEASRQARGGDSFLAKRFVQSRASLGAIAYEQEVASGSIPTRDLVHDWFNGQVWLNFPRAKSLLNAAHVGAGPVDSGNGRPPRRDALTLLDESGVLVLCKTLQQALALAEQDWPSFLPSMQGSDAARVVPFGHGLLEAMENPYPGLCGKALIVVVPAAFSVDLDCLLCQAIELLQAPWQLAPLPVHAVPGWFGPKATQLWSDTGVFRSKPTHLERVGRQRLVFQVIGDTLPCGKYAGQSLLALQGEESPDSREQDAG